MPLPTTPGSSSSSPEKNNTFEKRSLSRLDLELRFLRSFRSRSREREGERGGKRRKEKEEREREGRKKGEREEEGKDDGIPRKIGPIVAKTTLIHRGRWSSLHAININAACSVV